LSGVTPTLAVRSRLNFFLDYYRLPISVEPFTRLRGYAGPHRHAGFVPLPQRFVLCLRLLLRPSSALSPCKFATCMRALIPSPVPACLRSLSRPSLALSQSEFESLYMRALTPTHVPTGFRQSSSRPGQQAWPITGLTTRAFRRPLLLPTLRVIKYSDDVVFLFRPPHLSYHLPAPPPDVTIVL